MEEIVDLVPNNELPYWLMEQVTKDDGIDANQLPTSIRRPFKEIVLWGWNPAYNTYNNGCIYFWYWVNRDIGLIAMVVHTTGWSGRPILLRQVYLRRRQGYWEWADILAPDVQDGIRNWLALGLLAGKPDEIKKH